MEDNNNKRAVSFRSSDGNCMVIHEQDNGETFIKSDTYWTEEEMV